MTEALLSNTAGSLLSLVKKQFAATVIERWSTYRAERFLESLVTEVERELLIGDTSDKLVDRLDRILRDDRTSEALFDAYRRVALSRSRDYGPRIIAILTAQLIAQQRRATVVEERLFDVAENLNDSELVDFVDFLEGHLKRATADDDDVSLDDAGLRVEAGSDEKDSNWPSLGLDRSPLDLDDWFGPWAIKLRNLGVFREVIKEESWHYDVDPERHVDEPGTATKVTWSILVPREYLVLQVYIRQAMKLA